MDKIKVIAVVGPTASGKTTLAVNIAKVFGGEIVSADSMQLYKGMPIAAAVPTLAERQGIPHHIMEIKDRTERFTVADYVELAHSVIADISSRGKLPIIVGGTGLYVDSLINNTVFGKDDGDMAIRERLMREAEESGTDALLERLSLVDPQTAKRLHQNDKKRIIRALELYESTGMTITEQNEASHLSPSPYDAVMIGLRFCDRQKLYERIDKRVDIMLENGLVDEARVSYELSSTYPTAYAAIGHKELFGYFDGTISLNEAVGNLKQATRRYAKRQMTWFNRNELIEWIDVDTVSDVFEEAKRIITE